MTDGKGGGAGHGGSGRGPEDRPSPEALASYIVALRAAAACGPERAAVLDALLSEAARHPAARELLERLHEELSEVAGDIHGILLDLIDVFEEQAGGIAGT